MSTAPCATVVVPVRDDERGITACVEALLAQTIPLEVIVVDDGSRDATASVAAEAGARVLTIEGAGAGAARNAGVAASSGEFVLFTDGDCVPEARWAEALLAGFRSDVVAVKGVYSTRQSSSTAQFVQLEYEERYRRMQRCMKERGHIDFLDTYSLAVRRDAFVAIGGFDESFAGASVEDQEMSFRLARLGRFVFTGSAVVDHRHASTPRQYAKKKFRIGRGKATIARRHRDRLGSDSHTPSTLRWQLPCVAGSVLSLTLAPFLFGMLAWGGAAVGVALGVVGPGALSRELVAAATKTGPRGLAAALTLTIVRAWSLTLGFAWGVLSPEVHLEAEIVSRLVDPEADFERDAACDDAEPTDPVRVTDEGSEREEAARVL